MDQPGPYSPPAATVADTGVPPAVERRMLRSLLQLVTDQPAYRIRYRRLAWIIGGLGVLFLVAAAFAASVETSDGLGILFLAFIAGYVSAIGRIFVRAGMQFPVLARYLDVEAIRRDADALHIRASK